MRSKTLTPIGFLIELLGISINDMAKNIFVDRTTISKWKSNDRQLTAKSECFDKVVEYFLIQNSVQKRHILENLFSNVYGEVPYKTKDYLKTSMQKFLSHSVIPQEAQSILSQAKGNLYMCMTGVYAGVDGRKCVMDVLLDEAERQNKPGELYFFDRELFTWFLYDEKYYRGWLKRIVGLLEKDWAVSIIVNCSSPPEALSIFLYGNHSLYAYPKYHEYSFNSVRNINLLPTIYVIRDKLAVFGYNHGKQLYSCIFKDKYTLEHGRYYLQNLISECTVTIVPKTIKGRIEIFDRITSYELCDEPCYIVSATPNLIPSSDVLLQEILYQNGVIGELKSSLLKMMQTLRTKMLSSVGSYRHMLFDTHLEAPLAYERIYFAELSNIVGKDVYIKNEQYREHLKNAAQLISNPSSYSIALANPYDRLPSERYFFACKNKFYSLGVGDCVRFCAESSMVTTTYNILDQYWEKHIPAENKDKERVAKRLLEIANK